MVDMKRKYFEQSRAIIRSFLSKNFLLILIFLSLLSVLICLLIGLSQSVWFDEAYSVTVAKKSFSEIIQLCTVDVHPPFYYFILHIWGNIFGWGVIALRSLSAIFMGAAVFVAGIFIRKVFNTKAAYFSLLLIVLSPILLRYGFEIRMYSLASLIGVLATLLLYKAFYEISNKKRILYFAIYAVLVTIGMFTLYYMALIWLAHAAWLVWMAIKQKKSIFKCDWLLAYVGSVLLFLPWVPNFLKQVSGGALAPISQPMTVENLIGVTSFNFLYRPVWQLGAVYGLVAAVLIMAIIYIVINTYQKLNIDNKNKILLLGSYILVPIIALLLIGIFKPMYTERYLSHIAIGGLMFVGVVLSIFAVKKWHRILISILIIATMLFGISQLTAVGNYNFQRLQKPEVKNVSDFIEGCSDKEVIFAADPYVAIELGYYIGDCNIYFYSTDDNLGGGYAPLSSSAFRVYDINNQLSDKDVIFFVYYGESELSMPQSFSLTQKINGGGLTIEKYKSYEKN